MTTALEGITVLEFASYVSGPYAGMMLGDLGAEIIKVEDPKSGDPFRGWGAADYSATFGSVNRNKKSIILDLKSEEGVAAAVALAADADVLIENFRPGTMDRLGLGYGKLSALNSRLVYCSVTGFGGTGPYAERPGYDTVGQAMGGLLSVLTDLETPKGMGISLSDHLTGMMAAYGCLGALAARDRTGKGQRVETSLLTATLSFLGENAARYFEEGNVPNRKTRTQTAQVYSFVAGDDKPFVIHLSSPPKFWKGLCKVAGHEEWFDEDRFVDKATRRANYDELEALLADVFKTKPREHWLNRLLEEDVPSAPIYTLDETLADPQVQHLDMVREVPHPKVGFVKLIESGVRMSDTPPEIRTAAPLHGEHTEEILQRIADKAGAAE
ncbi:MAG: CaiB/BaiF CoA transferase family protein [Alphaproteobacteria bacterium]|jgi:crotonobetainyl-CoA:carnitine CoA-transferase CaiB-like acyl-CoA transferase